MIGQIVIVLLSVFCSNTYFTEAQIALPLFDVTVFNNCSKMSTKASIGDIQGFAFLAAKSGRPIRCATAILQPIYLNVFGINVIVGYTTTTYYYAFNDTNYTNLLTIPYQNTSYALIENPLKKGESQTYLSSVNTYSLNLTTYELITTGEVVGYVQSNCTTLGYATAICTTSEDMFIHLLVKNRPPQNAVVSQLKAQLPDNGLQGIHLSDVYHGSDCPYYKP